MIFAAKKIPTVLPDHCESTVIMIRLIFTRQEIAGMAGGIDGERYSGLISKYTNQAIDGDSYFLEIWGYIWEVIGAC